MIGEVLSNDIRRSVLSFFLLRLLYTKATSAGGRGLIHSEDQPASASEVAVLLDVVRRRQHQHHQQRGAAVWDTAVESSGIWSKVPLFYYYKYKTPSLYKYIPT